jgi:hypothetical protein
VRVRVRPCRRLAQGRKLDSEPAGYIIVRGGAAHGAVAGQLLVAHRPYGTCCAECRLSAPANSCQRPERGFGDRVVAIENMPPDRFGFSCNMF